MSLFSRYTCVVRQYGVCAFILCASPGLPLTGLPACAAEITLIADATFERGFQIQEDGAEKQVIQWNEKAGPPVWRLVHHHSQSSYARTNGFRFRADGVDFKDEFGWLSARPSDGSADLILGVDAHREFGGVYRAQEDPWPHSYVSQRIGLPHGHAGAALPSLAEIRRVDFSIDVRLLYDHPNKTDAYRPSIHAAQFLIFFTIQNLNRASPGYGDYYWFGIPIYDDRYPVTSLRAKHDKGTAKKKGTGKLIYSIGIQPFTDRVVADGEWVSVRGDLLPHILAGLEEAWRRGYLEGSRALSDHKIAGVLLGWEIPGLNHAALAIRNMRAVAITDPEK